MARRRQLQDREKAELKNRLAGLLAAREELCFACLHGSVLEPYGFRDVDVAVWVDPARVPREQALEYALDLSAVLERQVSYPVDCNVLNSAPLGFRYQVTRGELIWARDPEDWFSFRERTWRDYLDFAPLGREALLDLLEAREEGSEGPLPRGTA